MKKILFSALACVAFAGSSFASSELLLPFEVNKPCSNTVYIWSASGEFIGTRERVTETPKHSDCLSDGVALLKELEEEFPDASFEVVTLWGE